MMQQVAPGKYRTAHYAFATGLMNLGYTIGGIPSGWIQEQVGYVTFFIFVMFATIPSFLATWFAPFNIKYDPKTGKQIDDPAGSKP
jgi:PAT family beta-lactamase induction signal transducer AmpG